MAGPGDEMAPADGSGRSGFRASHADRERVIDLLKDAFAHGRLDHDDLDSRVGRAFGARTHAELAALIADLPAESASLTTWSAAPAPAARPPARVPARTPGSHTARDVAIGLIIGLGLVAVIVFGGVLDAVAFGMFTLPLLVLAPFIVIAARTSSRRRPRSSSRDRGSAACDNSLS